jgi:hypothetical protein
MDKESKALLTQVATQWFGPPSDPRGWIERKLKAKLWSGQRLVLDSIAANRYTVVPSAHDLGKSFLAAAVACQWIEEHELGEAFVVSTAPTSAQVVAVLWRYIEEMHRKARLTGQINMGRIPEWKIGKALVGYGRKPADYDEAGFQGIHCRYPLIVVDEAAGIPGQLWVAVDALATNENARVLAIGNPDDQNSPFRAMCFPGSGWNIVRLDGLRSPNFSEHEVRAASNLPPPNQTGDLYGYMVDNGIEFTNEKIPYDLSQLLLSPRWVAERMLSWGVSKDSDGTWSTSPLWDSRVRAQFPSDSSDAGVIPLSWVEASVARWKQWKESGVPDVELIGRRVFSCDVARYGDDDTVVAERIGHTFINVDHYSQQDTQTTALRLASRLTKYAGSYAVVDVIGVGGGVVDRLREMEHEVVSFNSASKTDMMDHSGEFSFPNTRSAAWWNLRNLLDPSDPATDLCIPDDEILIAELTAPKWKVGSGAKIMVEPKEETKKRLRRSPDSADAVVMSMWYAGLDLGSSYIYEFGGESDYAVPWR